MKPINALVFVFIFLNSRTPFVNSQTDSCSSNLNINGISFDTSNFHCFPVWVSQDFILRYQQTESNLWSFVVSAPSSNSYIGIGFSSDGSMAGSSAIVGWVNGAATIKQYYLGDTQPDSVIPDQGSLKVFGGSSAVISQSSRIYLAFQLNTSQPQSKLLYSVGPAGVFPSSPSFRLTEHQYKVSTTINYQTGTSRTGTPYARLRRSHGVSNMLGWGVLIPIGAITARYFKQYDSTWFYAHISIQTSGSILGLAGVICGLILNDRINANVAKHKAIGIIILALGCLQVTAFLARPDKASKLRKYWNWYHHNVGRVLIVLAIANVFYGIHLGKAGIGWNAGYGIALAFLCVIAIVLEFRMWARK